MRRLCRAVAHHAAVRVVTLNALGHQQDWPARRRVLSTGLRDLSADVVVFQEVFTRNDSDDVAELLGSDFQVFHQRGRDQRGGGASIASRWPLAVVHEADLQFDKRLYRSGWIGSLAVVEISVAAPIGRVLIAHHKPTWQSGAEVERERQAVASARAIEEILHGSERHVVLAGDFDATPDSASIRFWMGRQSLDGLSVCYQDAWEATHGGAAGHTFIAENDLRSERWRPRPGRRIDYIMVRCGDHGATLDVTKCELLFEEPVDGVWASDHFGVLADLEPAPLVKDSP
jgi:endonuclease/exonuclease/phosphatase family metal-dependent hydrolase